MDYAEPVSLVGKYASLVPLSSSHHDGLSEAVQDGELWNLWYTSIPTPDGIKKEINRRLDLQRLGLMNPFCVLDSNQKPIGMTSFMNIDQQNFRLEIGSTWYRHSAQKTAINTECKLMLLRHAFGKLKCIAVEFRTHFFNLESRRARAPKTSRDYIFAINKYLIPFFGKMAVASMRDETIEDFSAAAAEIGVCVTASPGRS